MYMGQYQSTYNFKMDLTNKEETLDLLYEVEKWYEGTDYKDAWISGFNKNMDETLLELDDYFLNDTRYLFFIYLQYKDK